MKYIYMSPSFLSKTLHSILAPKTETATKLANFFRLFQSGVLS